MTPSPVLLVLLFSILGGATLGAEPVRWAPVAVVPSQEAEVVRLLESRGLVAVGWANAVVDVSDFRSTETRPLRTLEETLTPWDPRWDPWLKELGPIFHPKPNHALVWVEATRQGEAQSLVGTLASGGGTSVPESRLVTGWLFVAFSVAFLSFRLVAEVLSGLTPSFRRWRWIGGPLVVVIVGWLMVGGSWGTVDRPLKPSASWLQHRWFQEDWPYGATWNDWKPRTPWVYKTYDHQNGRIVEGETPLQVPDEAWARAAYQGLDPHHVARLFPPENP